MKKKLEICCVSLKDCIHAQAKGADRIELCASMAAGGLTPSFGLFQLVKKHCDIPVMVMIRPRGVGFCYNEEEFMVMCADADYFLQHGADGIVFGCLSKQRHVDYEKTKQLTDLAHSYGKEAIFHRAIDQCHDLVQEVQILCEIGVDRVLTAGGPGNAKEYLSTLMALQKTFGEKVEIQMCGNIRSDNVVELMNDTNISIIHSACRVFKQDPSDPVCDQLSYENAYDKVCADQVAEMVRAMNQVS